ncbi:hypothetical protein [uncultured Jannaschia sp.]|uniref:hypothetical protein n=1 Tax=uncultured Jannaschia sp. TaxID=293347 RepID=UPI00261DE325|nr:hypothetical protein [uncultured Jannaschia sp.]
MKEFEMTGSMMNGGMTCGVPMLIGMAFLAALLLAVLGLLSAAAIKYLRSTPRPADGVPFVDRMKGGL